MNRACVLASGFLKSVECGVGSVKRGQIPLSPLPTLHSPLSTLHSPLPTEPTHFQLKALLPYQLIKPVCFKMFESCSISWDAVGVGLLGLQCFNGFPQQGYLMFVA